MTLSSRHRIRNSSPGGLRPSTLPLGHGGSPQYWLSHVDGEETFLFLSNRRDREPPGSNIALSTFTYTGSNPSIALLAVYPKAAYNNIKLCCRVLKYTISNVLVFSSFLMVIHTYYSDESTLDIVPWVKFKMVAIFQGGTIKIISFSKELKQIHDFLCLKLGYQVSPYARHSGNNIDTEKMTWKLFCCTVHTNTSHFQLP